MILGSLASGTVLEGDENECPGNVLYPESAPALRPHLVRPSLSDPACQSQSVRACQGLGVKECQRAGWQATAAREAPPPRRRLCHGVAPRPD